MSTGKLHKVAKAKVDRTRNYSVEEAIVLVKEAAHAKFDETVEVAVRLGVDPRKADQMVRGAVVLPNGLGKTVRVLVFAKGEKALEAKNAGADHVGGDDLVEKIQGGWYEFDTAIATPDMMGVVGKIGRLLGPRGLMPNPKVGTVTFEVGKAVEEAKSGKVAYRVEKAGIVHAPLGKVSFEPVKLQENLVALLDALVKAKPPTAKGTYLKKVCLSSTMGPGVSLDVPGLQALVK
ncbi:MAG: 50S ribosomal protein L1 [Syntrophotaleaceae bacterium]